MAEPRSQFRCLLGGQELTVTSFDPQLTLLDFLRLHQGLTGTKEGCAEGDCGACTVLIGRLSDQALHYEAVNACIVPLGSVDSAQILTVEHIADPEPHPVQYALARCHGSQCGFCTPGIAMSLAGLHEACASGRSSPDRRTINDTLAGNLCRCTGYGPIISAAEQACTEDRPDHLESLRAVAETTLSRWAGDEQYLCSEGAAGGFAAPTDLAACWSVQKRLADAQLIAGSTDVGLWINKEHRRFSNVIDLSRIRELRGIHQSQDALEIGAATTVAEALTALGALSEDLETLLRRFGSTQVRAQATVGGNIANGSPIGDLAPALIALDATLTLAGPLGSRSMPLENFFIDYGKQDRHHDELVLKVSVPLPIASDFHCWKISKRFDQDISAVCGAFAITVVDGVIVSARIAFGGMAATPRRARTCEDALVGMPTQAHVLPAARSALAKDFSAISDMRASAGYREDVAAGLLEKCIRSLAAEPMPNLYLGQPQKEGHG